MTAHRNPAYFSPLSRRGLLLGAGAGAASLALSGCAPGQMGRSRAGDGTADVTLRVAPHTLELAPGVEVRTLCYNDRAPGPVIRLPANRMATLDVVNATGNEEIAHWHGLYSPPEVDGAVAVGTPPVPPSGAMRYTFEPRPSGTHWYHTHAGGGENLEMGGYTGLFGFFIVDDGADPGLYDQEVLIAIHHWGAHWVDGRLFHNEYDHGREIDYTYATMNDRLLGHGEPVRVRQGERVLFRILNASGTENSFTTLSGHQMHVIAMDGVPVPTPQDIKMLVLAPGERADVIVTMDNPGVWVFGSETARDRERGMGMVIEYAGETGPPRWVSSNVRSWDYLVFGRDEPAAAPDEIIELAIGKIPGGANGLNTWTLNGKSWPETDIIRVREGGRYRLRFKNQTAYGHPLHLHRHHFEIASYHGRSGSGLMKDTLIVRPYSVAEVDLVANNPGPTLMHCHQAKHMEFGLMALMLYDGDQERMGIDEAGLRELLRNSMCLPNSSA